MVILMSFERARARACDKYANSKSRERENSIGIQWYTTYPNESRPIETAIVDDVPCHDRNVHCSRRRIIYRRSSITETPITVEPQDHWIRRTSRASFTARVRLPFGDAEKRKTSCRSRSDASDRGSRIATRLNRRNRQRARTIFARLRF